jgi:hypothetical protein
MRPLPLVWLSGLTLVAALAPSLAGCGSADTTASGREEGQTDYTSAPPASQGGGGAGEAAGAADSSAAPKSPGQQASLPLGPKVEETDIYRLEGNRLYFLDSYRGLMVFDVTNVDDPVLLGRSPMFGTPVEMRVKNGIATVVLGDWYGNAPDGTPFHGSVVRSIDANDPAHMKITGETQVKGWARDMRVVSGQLQGDTMYIVSEDYGWAYGYWAYGPYGMAEGDVAASPAGYPGYYGGGSSKVVISAVDITDGAATLKGTKEYDGFSGTFNVTATAILLAHDIRDGATEQPTGKIALDFVDISNPAAGIAPKGSIQVDGLLEGWAPDNGRWNIDFDGKHAAVIACDATQYGYCTGESGYTLSTVDFTDANAPTKTASLAIPSQGWAATARFADGRMYLSPREGYWTGSGGAPTTPIRIYDLSDPAAPKLAGSTSITGAVWMFLPVDATRVFALGNDYGPGQSTSNVSLRYLDVSNPAAPSVIGTSSFGNGWAWTPASDTFKAFIRDPNQKLVVLPFSGWSNSGYEYVNGVQLVEYDTDSITTRGAAKGKAWVERGIFVNGRIVSLSDQALSVVDYSDRSNPKVVKELTLARNVVSAQPQGSTIAQLSTDWWGYDQQTSELRVLPIDDAEETHAEPAAKTVSIDGTNAQVFRNGNLAYVVTTKFPKPPYSGAYYATPQIQVVDLSNGDAVLKGKIDLPSEDSYYWNWWGGCYWWDWYDGAGAVQVNGDVLAFRRTRGHFDEATNEYITSTKLYVVDLSNPDAPRVASTAVTPDEESWWGNMRVVGNTLYTSHYEYIEKPDPTSPVAKQYLVKYYLDQIDLSDRNAPKVGARINVPGMLVGASESDPSILYFVDYRWYGDQNQDELAVAKIAGDKAFFRSSTPIGGYVGNVFVRGDKAYMSAEDYVKTPDPNAPTKSFVKLHEIDLTNPSAPVDRASTPKDGWGWLVGVEGDRAIITSGWGQVGLDIYKLNPGAAPTYDQFARTRGWWTNALERQGDDLYLSSGYWGVQRIHLQ